MKVKAAIPVVLFAVLLSGCVLRGKPKTPAKAAPAPVPVASPAPVAKAEPLSAPQTQVQLPAPQPLDPDALATAPPEQQRPEQPTVQRPVRRNPPAPQTRSEAAPAQPPVAAPPEQAQPDRPPIETLVPADVQRQLQAAAQAKKREVRQALSGIQIRTAREADLKRRIEFFLNQSDQAEQRGNMSDADAHAKTALGLVRELQGGR